ncbi:hypothetical protein NIES4103_22010 [Nostoc sp. NIES-4103]|nr:hypothetical protein NIES4103_22010 [Nostoc sp. NIES-4103]
MMTENNTNAESISQPIADSDYYLVWHSLEYIKRKITNAQKYMSAYRNGDYQSSQQIKDFLIPAFDKLGTVIDKDLDYVDEDEEDEEDEE